LDDSIEIEDKNKFLNGINNKENIQKKQEEIIKKKDDLVKANNKNSNEMINNNKMQIEQHNQNLVANGKNVADSAKEKKIDIDKVKDSANNVIKDNSKLEKAKTFNKKAKNEACKCTIF
jgi:hypothetical protein